MKAIGLTIALALALAPPAFAQKVSSDTTPGVSFSSFSTFSFVNPSPPAGMDPVAYERIRMGIEQSLTGKGYAKAAASGDMSIIITVGARDKTDVNTWGAWGRQVDVHQYTEGSLAVDAFNTASKQPLWHGQATETVGSHLDPAKLQKAVDKLMAQFPAK